MSEHGIIAAFKEGCVAGATGNGDNPYSVTGEPLHFSAWEAGEAEQAEHYRVTPLGEAYRMKGRATLADIWPADRPLSIWRA